MLLAPSLWQECLHLPYISLTSRLYLPYISPMLAPSLWQECCPLVVMEALVGGAPCTSPPYLPHVSPISPQYLP